MSANFLLIFFLIMPVHLAQLLLLLRVAASAGVQVDGTPPAYADMRRSSFEKRKRFEETVVKVTVWKISTS